MQLKMLVEGTLTTYILILKIMKYFVSPPLLKTPMTIKVLKAFNAINRPIIINIFIISGDNSFDTLNTFNNNGILAINKSPNINPVKDTKMENFLE